MSVADTGPVPVPEIAIEGSLVPDLLTAPGGEEGEGTTLVPLGGATSPARGVRGGDPVRLHADVPVPQSDATRRSGGVPVAPGDGLGPPGDDLAAEALEGDLAPLHDVDPAVHAH